MPLSVIRDGRKPTKPWLPSDRLLSVALTLHDQSFGACGHPMDKAFGGQGAWDVETTVCAACAAEERYRSANTDPEPGLKVFAVEESETINAPGEVKPVFAPPTDP